MEQLTFHCVSLPHTQTSAEFSACAYTAKVVKFCRMMKSLGHRVFLYASEENDAPCDELVTVITRDEQTALFGRYDHRREFFRIEWEPGHAAWGLSNTRAAYQIGLRAGPRDFVCLIGGVCQKPIADALPAMQSVEFGIGYKGVFSNFRVFESYAWMHWVYGALGDDNGRFYDAVIPNYFDPADFPEGDGDGGYYLFLGRLVDRKGPAIAVEATRRIGARLLLAGQGVDHAEPGRVEAGEVTLVGDHIEHVGFADPARRAQLMGGARAVFVPTTYVEPFGGVSVEAMMCGTPVIATDFGAFAENVVDGVTGYRFRTVGEAVWAAENAGRLDRARIRRYAVENFGMDRVRMLYQAYFEQLHTLWDEGWYSSWSAGVADHRRYATVSA